ncbi:MAG TPA: prolyl oligopeptidase family serine peptidase [Vicinamibacterales bacterium]|nr:prolyl oligopeptidase family serine peptidase [Vicinamibacterales bacterium]
MSVLKKAALLLACTAAVVAVQGQQKTFPPTTEQKAEIHKKLAELSARVAGLGDKKIDPALLADVQIYKKAVEYILRFPEEFSGPNYVAETIAALDTGIGRAIELENGTSSWTRKTGNVVRAFVSRIDGSVQPYGLTIPAAYDGKRAMRLDVWLHGSQLDLNEVRFVSQQAGPHGTSQILADDYIQLEPLARMNHSYKFYSETDVYEAIAAVRTHYNIDPERIVLRGHSSGGHQSSGRLALQNPSFFAAFEASAGYAETKEYAASRLPKEGLPPYQEAALHYVDSQDYALNGFNIPFVSYGGEKDPQLRASVRLREAVEKEGFRLTKESPYKWTTTDLRALFLIGPDTGHSWHKESKVESEAFLRKAIEETAGKAPNHVRFVTYTTRYNNAHWVTVEGLEETYKRADVDAKRSDDMKQYTVTTKNVARVKFSVPAASFTIDGQTIKAGANPTFEKASGKWAIATGRPTGLRKIHRLQGPIEDAFTDGFLAVRGTGQPWNPSVHDYTAQRLDVFKSEFAKWMRGDIRTKNDSSVSAADIANYNLVLFGDPGSNSLIAKVIGRLPIQWTKSEIAVGSQKFSSAEHALVLIYPNPLNPQRYVVLNTGHTFSADRVASGTESIFFPRLGDYAVLTSAGEVKVAGFFDESWRLK